MADTPMTDEEAAALRQQLAAHDAVQNETRKAANRAKLQPLVDLGLGGAGVLTCSSAELATALRTNAMALADLDATLPNLAFSTAQVIETIGDRVRSLVVQNAPAPAPPEA